MANPMDTTDQTSFDTASSALDTNEILYSPIIESTEINNHCKYYVERKRRFCHMTVRKGKKYCGEHQQDTAKVDAAKVNAATEDERDRRIPCPLDPLHTCYQSKLTRHLFVCNAKRKLDAEPAFIAKGVNLGDKVTPMSYVPLSKLDVSLVDSVIKKIHSAYEKLPEFPEEILQHVILQDKLSHETCGNRARKHLLQNASLLGHLEQSGLVADETCFIEFGAGKAQLTYWLGKIAKNKSNSCFLLVDRYSHRHKRDNKLKNEENNLMVKRVRADIADLQLNRITEIQPIKYKVGIAKHLCGRATDLAIRCLVKSMNDEPNVNVRGLVLAFCCHHMCEYSSYVGKEYLQQCGFVADEFSILCSIASWATCRPRDSEINAKSRDDSIDQQSSEEDTAVQSLGSNEREIIGRKAKALLNWGRLLFLQVVGFQAKLIYYISTDVSLENMCIVATRECTS